MYPNLNSDFANDKKEYVIYEKKPQMSDGQNEISCQHQFLPKTKKLTKDFFNRVYIYKLADPETYVIDEELKTSRLIIIAGLIILFLTSLFGIVFMWYTNGFNELVYSNIVLSEGSPAFEMWRKPIPKALARVYLFNYTNVDRYEDGTDKKLNVEEKGPYVYEETMERVNVKFNGSLVSFQYKRSYRFIPELSNGRQNDMLVVPNLLLLAAAGIHRNSNFFTRLTISSALTGRYSKPFHHLAADRFIMGYDDDIYALTKSMMRFQNQNPADKLGLFGEKIGVNPTVFTVNTGMDDIDKINSIQSINGENELQFWSTKECNSIEGTDGTMFSPVKVSEKKPIKIFLKEMCRTLTLDYKGENTILDGEIPSHRYVLPDNIFDSPDVLPENQCFCDMEGGSCPSQGIFNATLCAMGAPVMVSYPHFYKADKSIQESITGLKPERAIHETFYDLHPKLGFPMNGKSNIQVNMRLEKTFGFSQLNLYEDGLIVPLAWFELSVEDKTLPQDIKDLIGTATHTLALVENLLKYGSIVILIVTIVPILANLRHRMRKPQRTDSIKPLQKEETDC